MGTPDTIHHHRSVYDFVTMTEDLGGIIEILFILFAIFINPISKFSFNLKAIKKLFNVRTSDKSII